MKLEVRVGVWKRKLLLLCVTTAVLWGCRNNTSFYAKGYDPSKRDCSFLRQKHEFYHTIGLYNYSTWISHSVVHSYRPIWAYHTINRAIVDVIVRSTFSYAFSACHHWSREFNSCKRITQCNLYNNVCQ